MDKDTIKKPEGRSSAHPNIPHVMKPVIKANIASRRPAARPTPPEALPPEVIERRKLFPKVDPHRHIDDHPNLGV